MNKKIRIMFSLMLAAMIWIMSLSIISAQSQQNVSEDIGEGIKIESQVGYNGNYSMNKQTPVKLTLTNQLGRDIKGELVLNAKDENGFSVAHIIPLELTKDSTVDTYISIEAEFSKDATYLQFYEGNVDNGKSIQIIGNRSVIGSAVHTNNVFGIVANDPDTLNFVSFFTNNGYTTTPIILGEQFYAETMQDLSMFSIIALNDVATSSWSEEKVQALKDWVANGGVLLVGGGAGYRQTAAELAEMLPVEATGTTSWSNTQYLNQYVNSEDPLSTLEIAQGKLVRGEIIIADQEIPIVASSDYGYGKVYYVAFDLGLKPFSIWDGRTEFIQAILSEKLMMSGGYYYGNTEQALQSASEYFPRLQSPNVSILILIFFGYALLVAPILYLILKAKDRREWSWWMIPAVAVLSTMLIVLIGSSDKRSPYVHRVEVIKANADHIKVTGASSVFIPNNKDIEINIADANKVQILNRQYYNNSEVSTSKTERIYHAGNMSKVTFTNNKYWTKKSVYEGDTIYTPEQYGTLLANLEVSGSDIILHLTNETGEDLQYITLAIGTQANYITDLAAGESYSYTLPTSLMSAMSNQYFGNTYHTGHITQALGWSWDEYQRETSLLNHYNIVNLKYGLTAFSYNDTKQFKVNDQTVKSDLMKLWIVDLDQEFSNLGVDGTSVHPRVSHIERGTFNAVEKNYYVLSEATVELKYTIPMDQAGQQLNGEFFPRITQFNGIEVFQIYNQETMEWETAPALEFSLAPYVDELNMIQIRLDSGQSYYEGELPTLLLKREVQ